MDGQRWWTFACVLAARHCIIALIICCTSHIGNKSLSLSLSLFVHWTLARTAELQKDGGSQSVGAHTSLCQAAKQRALCTMTLSWRHGHDSPAQRQVAPRLLNPITLTPLLTSYCTVVSLLIDRCTAAIESILQSDCIFWQSADSDHSSCEAGLFVKYDTIRHKSLTYDPKDCRPLMSGLTQVLCFIFYDDSTSLQTQHHVTSKLVYMRRMLW